MGLFRKPAGATTLHAPVSGELVELSSVADKTFRDGLMGPGVAFVPSSDVVCAPCDGVLTMVAATRHAFGVTSRDGIEVLVHIGIDTVELRGKGLAALVAVGSRVRAGQPIIRLDRSALAATGADLTTPMVITSSAPFEVQRQRDRGPVEVGDSVVVVHR